MRVLHIISGERSDRRLRASGFACLVVLASVLLGLVGARSAAAITTSATPSSAEPFRACPVATPGYYECEEIVEPAAYVNAKSASGEITKHKARRARKITYGNGSATTPSMDTITITPTRIALTALKISRTLRVSITIVFHPRSGSQ